MVARASGGVRLEELRKDTLAGAVQRFAVLAAKDFEADVSGRNSVQSCVSGQVKPLLLGCLSWT